MNFNTIFIDINYLAHVGVKLAIAMVLFGLIRYGFTRFLGKKIADIHWAESISVAALMLGGAIILSGTVFGLVTENPLQNTTLFTLLYGALGVLLMLLSHWVFDRVALPRISLKQEVAAGNISAAIVDASNIIATALIINAAMRWTDHNTLQGLLAVFVAFVIGQILLFMVTRFRVWWVKRQTHKRERFEHLLHANNASLALRFAGHRIGAGFVLAAAITMVMHDAHLLPTLFALWAGVAVVFLCVAELLEFLTSRLLFWGVDLAEALEKNHTVIGLALGMVYIAICLMLYALLPGVGWMV